MFAICDFLNFMFFKESIKQFLKPSWGKILLMLIFGRFFEIFSGIFLDTFSVPNISVRVFIYIILPIVFSYITGCIVAEKIDKSQGRIILIFFLYYFVESILGAGMIAGSDIYYPPFLGFDPWVDNIEYRISIFFVSLFLSYLISYLLIYVWDKVKSKKSIV